ncbi:MAG: IS630 family transposase [bacterium]|nr:IS630 family transposase [bacterium]
MFEPFFNWCRQVGQQVAECVVEGTRRIAVALMGGERRAAQALEPQVPEGIDTVRVSPRLRCLLEATVRRTGAPQRLVQRARIILALAGGLKPGVVARTLGIMRQTVGKWRDRWLDGGGWLAEAEAREAKDQALGAKLEELLLDARRSGRPATFSAEQVVKVIALACEPPRASGRPINRWGSKDLAAELVKRGVVPSISRATVSRLLREAKIKPHLSRCWLNALPKDQGEFDAQVRAVRALYKQARQPHRQGVRLVCVDEKSGMQALGHKHPAQGVKPGRVARIEHEHTRHGTLCLMANFEAAGVPVATGRVFAPSIGPTRTEEDFLAHVKQTVATDPQARWIFVMDNLNVRPLTALVSAREGHA